jgi:predicted transposase/invertase (TIGR01784 family)
MAHYLDPKNDLAFKRIFGEHSNLCISLLNSMLPLDEDRRIVSIEYRTTELLPEIFNLKNSIVDVRCTDHQGRQFIVEMQMYWSESFKSRVLLNASKAYVMQLDKAKEYKLLQPVYALSFVNDTFDKTSPEYYHHYKIVNVKNTEEQIKGLEFVFIELPKFKPENRAEKKLQELWLRFLTEINECTTEIPGELLENSDTGEAVKYTETSAYTKEQLLTYDKIRDAIMVEISVMSDAEEKGIGKGVEIGKEIGVEIGKEIGRTDGIKENQITTAHKMLGKGFSISDISEITGLSEEEIRETGNNG